MKSPFPGMDPYLERFWNDIHGKLITYIADELNAALPARYRATMQERLVIADVERPATGTRYPDVAVLEWPSHPAAGGVATEVYSQHLQITAPEELSYFDHPLTQYSVEILDSDLGEKVVTAIELLSPENKRPGDGMTQFQRKQGEYRSAKINRVEIDFLRGGRRMFEFPSQILISGKGKPYYITVHRGDRPLTAEVYAIDIRDPLPVIKIPLRAGDEDLPLDLQPLLDRVYKNGRFPIDYSRPADPPLTGEDAGAAVSILESMQIQKV